MDAIETGERRVAAWALRLLRPAPRVSLRLRRCHHERQSDPEGRSFPLAVARGMDRPAVQFDEMARNSEPQPEAVVLPRHPPISLSESLEHMGQEIRTDAAARVADDNVDVRARAFEPQVDPSSVRC